MKDLIIDENFELAVNNGDFIVDTSDVQQQNLLLISDKGDWKEFPTRCVGVQRWLSDDEPEDLLAEIKKEFQRDGMKVNDLTLTDDKILNIDASY
ncbi:MAG: oxidase [Bacteroidota bacterium]|nr:oxidase [Bacteroidota bacterium]